MSKLRTVQIQEPFNITGSLYGTSSWAESSSFALTASFASSTVPVDLSGYTTTSSFNNFTSSYYSDSQSFDSRITNNSSSLSLLSGSFESFSESYNTGSFTGSFIGDGSQLTGIISSKWTGSNPITRESNVEITGSLKVTNGITSSLYGTSSWTENYSEKDPIFTAISGTFATTGSNTFYGLQTISSSTDSVLDLRMKDDGLWALRIYNNVYSSSSIGLASWIDNSGISFLGTETDKPLYIYNNANYYTPTLLISSSGVTVGAGGITGSLLGTASFAETASNILGGKATHIPYFITDTSLATSSIYQSGSSTVIINQDNATSANPEALYVWQPSTSSINVISGKGNLDNYLQLNIQNTNQGPNASSDVVATANNGSETDNYIDMGINSQNYAGFLGDANDSYLYSHGHDMWIGNINDGYNLHLFNSSSINPLVTITPSNDVDVNTRLNAPNITGSLEGTASWAKNVISASHAVNSDFANYAQTAGTAANGGVTQLIAGSGVSLIPSNGLGNVTVIATGVGGVTILSGSNVTQSFSNSNTWNFTHNLGVRTPIISVFDSNYNQVIPQGIQLVDTASAIITFPTLESGFAVASVGGVTGNALSSSYSLLATYADTASFYTETDPVYISQKPTLATTGSNVFRGTQTVTGSLNITGSTTQTGNNTLIGSTVLSGSINISGSQTFNGTSAFYGNHTLSGSNTIIGNTIMSGSIVVSGSSNFRNSVFIVTGSAFFKGTHQVSGSTSITGSFNVVDGDINIVSGSSFTRWGNKLFNYGQFADTTTQSGSANTAYAMKFNTTDFALNTRIVSGSRITVDNTGVYNIQFSAQLGNTANTSVDFDIWFAYTGSNIPNSNTQVTLNKVPGSTGRLVAAWNVATPIQAGDYVEIYWSCTGATGQIQSAPAAVTPTRPAIPSVIATLTQIA